jgi:PAS domain S-box-containing protein/diguanylate cyclase (GGDEF)-like protein
MSSLSSLSPDAYRTILEDLPIGVYLVDRERRIVLWNDRCARITGHPPHEVIGRCCADELLMHCDGSNGVMCGMACPLLETMHDGHPREADLFLRHKDGQRVPVRVRAVPVRDDTGAIIGACECFDERALVLPERPSLQMVDEPGSMDEVTRLPNHQGMLRRLQANLQDFETSRIPFGVLYLAIDNLEGLLAARGVNAVNRVLYATAQTLARRIGADNLVGRSDRGFLAILKGCTGATLLESAICLKRLVGLEAIPWWGNTLTITLSAGGTVARPEDTPDELVRRAEEALNGSMKNGVSQAAIV